MKRWRSWDVFWCDLAAAQIVVVLVVLLLVVVGVLGGMLF
jgi:hypothetical protein